MNQSVPVSGYKTALAILIAIVLVVPGMFIGGLVSYIYLLVSHFGVGSGGSSWIPFLAGFMHILWFIFIPEMLRGFVAIWSALFITFWLLNNVNRDVVAYSVASVYLVVSALLFLFGLYHSLLDIEYIGLIGMAFGLGSGAMVAREIQ